MTLKTHGQNDRQITEVTGEGIFIRNIDEAFQIMMDQSFSGVQKLIFHQSNMANEFFDLKTKMLGELLQKAVNYKVQIAFIGEFSKTESQSLKDLIHESNKGTQYFFTEDLDAALAALKR